MRHIPTSLYIDTEVFVRHGLRLDTKEFNSLKDTFAKGGLRLLVPAIMERELLRSTAETPNFNIENVESISQGRGSRQMF